MNREDFIKAEANILRAFMERFVMDDFLGACSRYSRQYRCDCGFVTSDAGAIFDHKCDSGMGR